MRHGWKDASSRDVECYCGFKVKGFQARPKHEQEQLSLVSTHKRWLQIQSAGLPGMVPCTNPADLVGRIQGMPGPRQGDYAFCREHLIVRQPRVNMPLLRPYAARTAPRGLTCELMVTA